MVIGFALMAGAGVALFASTSSAAIVAYESAPTCAGIAEAQAGKACRYTATATVTAISGTPDVTYVSFELPAYGPFLMAEMPPNTGTDSGWSLVVGGPAQVELRGARVTRVDGAPTSDNPERDPRPGTMRSIAFLLAALGLGFIAWALLRARARRNGRDGGTGIQMGLGPVAVGDGLWGR